MRKFSKKTLTVAIVVGLSLAGASAAFAYWTTEGMGTGTAAVGTDTSSVTVVQTSTISGLAPGIAAKTLSGNFTNGNGSAVRVDTVTASIAGVTKALGAAGGPCNESDFTLADAVMTVGAEIPSGVAQGAWTGATIQFNDKTNVNQDACKGATVNIHYVVND